MYIGDISVKGLQLVYKRQVNDNGSIVFERGGYFYRDINLGIIANIRNQ